MTARPFTPEMGRARRPVHGGWQALGFLSVLVCTAWAGQHGAGVILGWIVVGLAVAAVIGLWVGFYIYCWRRMDGPR